MSEKPPQYNIENSNNENTFEPRESAIDRWNDFRNMEGDARDKHINSIQDPKVKEATMEHFGALSLFEDMLNRLRK